MNCKSLPYCGSSISLGVTFRCDVVAVLGCQLCSRHSNQTLQDTNDKNVYMPTCRTGGIHPSIPLYRPHSGLERSKEEQETTNHMSTNSIHDTWRRSNIWKQETNRSEAIYYNCKCVFLKVWLRVAVENGWMDGLVGVVWYKVDRTMRSKYRSLLIAI